MQSLKRYRAAAFQYISEVVEMPVEKIVFVKSSKADCYFGRAYIKNMPMFLFSLKIYPNGTQTSDLFDLSFNITPVSYFSDIPSISQLIDTNPIFKESLDFPLISFNGCQLRPAARPSLSFKREYRCESYTSFFEEKFLIGNYHYPNPLVKDYTMIFNASIDIINRERISLKNNFLTNVKKDYRHRNEADIDIAHLMGDRILDYSEDSMEYIKEVIYKNYFFYVGLKEKESPLRFMTGQQIYESDHYELVKQFTMYRMFDEVERI